LHVSTRSFNVGRSVSLWNTAVYENSTSDPGTRRPAQPSAITADPAAMRTVIVTRCSPCARVFCSFEVDEEGGGREC
jgi:hypothetical protein